MPDGLGPKHLHLFERACRRRALFFFPALVPSDEYANDEYANDEYRIIHNSLFEYSSISYSFAFDMIISFFIFVVPVKLSSVEKIQTSVVLIIPCLFLLCPGILHQHEESEPEKKTY